MILVAALRTTVVAPLRSFLRFFIDGNEISRGKFYKRKLSSEWTSVSRWVRWSRVALAVVALVVAQMAIAAPSAVAQAVTWTKTDINTGSTGSYTYTTGNPPQFTISGTGTGVGFFDDSFVFVGTPAFGSLTIQGRVASQTNTGAGALAGLCIRNSTQNQYAYSYVLAVTPSNGLVFYRRYQNGGNSTIATGAGAAPMYLKLARDGNPTSGYTVNAYYGTDGINWTLLGSAVESNTIPMPNKFYTGFVVSSSASGGTASTAVFDFVSYLTSVPQQASNLLLWLRSDVGVTTSSGAVTSWADQSGNSNNATQGTGANRPTLVTGSANSGVLPSISFNGSSHYLTLPTGFANLSAGASAFIMLKPTAAVATGTPFVCGNSSNSDALIVKTTGSGTNAALYAFNGATSSNVTTSSNPLSTSAFQLVETVYTPGSSPGTGVGKVYVGGTLQATATTLVQNLNNTSRTINRIGTSTASTEWFAGNICEILVYSSPVSDSQRKSIESYMLSKYGVGATPQLEAPQAIPGSGVFLPQQSILLSQNQNAPVYFTTDGTTPDQNSLFFYNNLPDFLYPVGPEYTPRINKTTALKTLAKAPFFSDSAVTTFNYQSDDSTSPIPRSGLIEWLRASNVTTSGSNVTNWQDVSGSGNNATNGANQPTLVSGAVNGWPAVNFSGTQFLQMPNTGFSNFTSGLTAILVAKPNSVTAGARLFDLGNGATSDNVSMSLPSSTGLTFSTYTGSTGSSVTASSGVTLGQFQLLEAAYNGTNTATLFVNAAQSAQSTTMQTLSNLARTGYLGQDPTGANRFNGQIAELLLWNRQLTVAERTAVEGYLLNKYQLPSTNTVATPILSVSTSTLTNPSQVAIAGPNGAQIRYTIDGSTPTISSALYTGPLNVMWTQTVKAIAVLNGISSSVASATFTLDSTKFPAPSASDTRTLNLQQQLPNVGIPHDANQP